MSKAWINPRKVNVPLEIKEGIGGHPIIAETLVRRGCQDLDKALAFLYPRHYSPAPFGELPDVSKVTTRINYAVDKGETILVWGDFDVDGQTSTTLLVQALTDLGAEVIYHIPLRSTEGHGIDVEVLERIILESSSKIQLLITCDTGITAHEAVDFAKNMGLDVIITDHHDLPSEIPSAFAVINPKLLPGSHPLATLPGVGVAYKLVEALYDYAGFSTSDQNTSNQHPPLPDLYLDLTALGIVADLAEQRGDTRYLLQRGLYMLRNTQRLGLQSLMEFAEINPSQLDEDTIGFQIAPRLNALGRLSDSNPIVEFLTTDDRSHARVFSNHLEGLNERRKLLTEQITQAAMAQIERDNSINSRPVLVLSHPGWHTGVIGIVASRLVEQFGKPTILLSIGDDNIAKGSARSVEGVNISEAIATQKNLLISFGGHPGAAGLSLHLHDIPQFRRGLGQAITKQLGDQQPVPHIQIDGYLPISEITLEMANEINRLAPFGEGNPPLTLVAQNVKITSKMPIGRRKNHLRLVVTDENGNYQNVLWWNGAGRLLPDGLFDLAYKLQTTTYRGESQLQIIWVDFHVTESSAQNEIIEAAFEIIDHRGKKDPTNLLESIREENEIQIWSEGGSNNISEGLSRNELAQGVPLAVWTTPPGPDVWQSILNQVGPTKIHLFAVNTSMDEPRIFLERLAGLAKFGMRDKNGKIEFESLAIATCQQETTVRMGLLWLEAKGFILIRHWNETTISISKGSGIERQDISEIEDELISMLAETAAYRTYFRQTENNLI